MFNDDFEKLISFFAEKVKEKEKKETGEEEKDEQILQKYINRIRRISCLRVNKKRSSPMMIGGVLGRSSNKKEVFIADTGTSVIILPVNIAKCNGEVWTPVEFDKPPYVRVTGFQVDIMGQANVWTVFDNIKGGHNLQVRVARQEAEEILIHPD